jgi:hypothetical protein
MQLVGDMVQVVIIINGAPLQMEVDGGLDVTDK